MTGLDLTSIRLTECEFASVVTDEILKFELPRLSAGPPNNHGGDRAIEPSGRRSVTDTTAIFVSETDTTVQFGRDLFDALWADSDPIGPYLHRQFPGVWE